MNLRGKSILLFYGFLMAALFVFLEVINYKAIVHQMDVRWYGFIIALLFLGVGLFIGYSIFGGHESIGSEQRPVSHDLSQRELDVLRLMSEGLTNQEIADRMYVSVNTVKTHISNLYSKLDVNRRTQAVSKARAMHLV